jgi:hypothetical protein
VKQAQRRPSRAAAPIASAARATGWSLDDDDDEEEDNEDAGVSARRRPPPTPVAVDEANLRLCRLVKVRSRLRPKRTHP